MVPQGASRQEFGVQVSQSAETAATAAASKAKAIVEARYIMAKRFPRDMDSFREKMLKECRRPTFAAVARYEKPIGRDKTKWPRGPSIRFAEAAVRNMTNMTVETYTTYDDREKRIVSVVVTDLESNVPYDQDVTITKTVERRQSKEGDTILRTRKNSYGDTVFILEATDDEIVNKQQALVSKAIRTLGLRLIPGDIVDECMAVVVDTLQRQDAQDPDAAKRRLFDAFAELGIQAAQLKEYLGHEAATLTPKELTELRGLYSAIRDGESTWRDVMETKDGQGKDGKSEGGGSKKDLPACTPEAFEKKKAGWKATIEGGKKSVNDLIATIETRELLSADQKVEIASWVKPVEGQQ